MNIKRTSLCIVTYNSSSYIIKCLDSIIKTPESYKEIIIIDNSTKNSSSKLIKKYSPRNKIIINKENIGFSKACNQAAKIAKGEYLLFLNPDTEIINRNFFERILAFYKKNKHVGAVGVKTLNFDQSLQPSFGSFPSLSRVILDRVKFFNKNFGILIRDEKLYNKVQKVDWVSGACLLVSKKAFQQAGGFDEKIFMYGEDFDLCYKLKKMGYDNYYYPGLKIFHKDSGKNIPLRKPHKYYFMRLGLLFFLKKHRSKIEYSFFKKIIKLESIILLFVLSFRKKGQEEKKVWKEYLLKSLKISL